MQVPSGVVPPRFWFHPVGWLGAVSPGLPPDTHGPGLPCCMMPDSLTIGPLLYACCGAHTPGVPWLIHITSLSFVVPGCQPPAGVVGPAPDLPGVLTLWRCKFVSPTV